MPTLPMRIALVSDNEIVAHGVTAMLEADDVRVTVRKRGASSCGAVDITVIDSSLEDAEETRLVRQAVQDPLAGSVVLLGWGLTQALADRSLSLGCRGCCDRSVSSQDLLSVLRRVHRGEVVLPPVPIRKTLAGAALKQETYWGQGAGLTVRESEVLGMITSGRTNLEIADACFLSINTVKSYVRSSYRKIGVQRRAQAVKWGMERGQLHADPSTNFTGVLSAS